ncbi:MAG TPA: cardiolipin synthase [Vicinamibacterales bacterium]|nr:cardiolipin synthase [Vicinamibacterales bacterium]
MVALTLAFAYAISVTAMLALQNRSPQSTFAWVLLFVVFPPGALLTYIMFGRGRYAFSRQQTLTKLLERSTLADRAAAVVAAQPEAIARLADTQGDFARLAGMLWASGRSPLTTGNHVEILQNATEKYPRLLDDIRAASQSVHLLYYEWASDRFTEEVARLLRDKVRAGVEVRILYDPVGSYFMLDRRYVERLRRDGIQMQPFSPVYQLHTLSYRNHRKVAIVDGRIGYSGGLNMTEKHLTGPAGFTGWRDTHTRVTGKAVTVLQLVFATMWANATGENLFDERYLPAIQAGEDGVAIQVVSAGPDSRWETIRQAYLAMIALARHHVYLQSPFLILDTSVAEAMTTAALAGVDVRVMIAPDGGEVSPAYRAGMTYAADMARAGVQVCLYKGAYFHSKTICVDSRICSIGSANIDIRSFSINYETNLVVYDEAVTRELEQDFLADLAHCVPFSADEYDAQKTSRRLLDSVMRLGSPLI